MSRLTEKEGFLRLGDVFYDYDRDKQLYFLFKVIATGENDTIGVCAYWPEPVCPTLENRSDFSIRTDCEELDVTTLQEPIRIGNEPVTAEETAAHANFLRIRDGLRKRAQEPAFLIEQADQRRTEHDWEEAAHLYTIAASFAKYNTTIFDKRGYCLLQLERFSEAIADFEHSLDLQPDNVDVLNHCAEAAIRYGKTEKALEKIQLVLKKDSGNKTAQALLEKIRKGENLQ